MRGPAFSLLDGQGRWSQPEVLPDDRGRAVLNRRTSSRNRPSALLFEFDNVLYDATAWERWLLRVLRQVIISGDVRSLLSIWEQQFRVDVHRGRCSFLDGFTAFLRSLGLTAAQVQEIEAASEPRRRQFCDDIRPLPGVRKTLDELAGAGITLGVLADSASTGAALQSQLNQLGFGGLFSLVLSSVDLGAAKPDHLGFETALRQFGLPAARVGFVACRGEHLNAASRLGMPTIAFNCHGQASADVYLNRFDELTRFMRDWPIGE